MCATFSELYNCNLHLCCLDRRHVALCTHEVLHRSLERFTAPHCPRMPCMALEHNAINLRPTLANLLQVFQSRAMEDEACSQLHLQQLLDFFRVCRPEQPEHNEAFVCR